MEAIVRPILSVIYRTCVLSVSIHVCVCQRACDCSVYRYAVHFSLPHTNSLFHVYKHARSFLIVILIRTSRHSRYQIDNNKRWDRLIKSMLINVIYCKRQLFAICRKCVKSTCREKEQVTRIMSFVIVTQLIFSYPHFLKTRFAVNRSLLNELHCLFAYI